MDMGGNVGTQSTTIFARGLALGHIDVSRIHRHIRREVTIGLTMGVLLGIIGGFGAYVWQGAPNDIPQIGLAVGISPVWHSISCRSGRLSACDRWPCKIC